MSSPDSSRDERPIVVALVGKREVTEATPPVPERTIQSVQEDVHAIKERTHRA